MPLLDLDRLTAGLSATWTGFLRDWDCAGEPLTPPKRRSTLLA